MEKIIHISIPIVARGMKFGQNMDVDDPKVDTEGQGHGPKVKVTRSKKRMKVINVCHSRSHLPVCHVVM